MNPRQRYLLSAVRELRVRVDHTGRCLLDDRSPVTVEIKALAARGLVRIPEQVAWGSSRYVTSPRRSGTA